MSLKTRLRISIVTLVTLLVLAQCVVSLRIAAEANFKDALDRADSIARQVHHLVLQRVTEQAALASPPPATIQASKVLWQQLVEKDPALPSLLEKTLATSGAVVEILVCDETGRILASSSPSRSRITFQSLPDFTEWQLRPVWDRLIEVLRQSKDYAIVVPLGVPELPLPILSIRVVVSSVLIRNAIMPQVRSLSAVSVLSLLTSVLLAYLFSNVVFRSLARLSQRIENIAAGGMSSGSDSLAKEGKEFAEMQSKLDVLSQQFQGARDDVQQLRNNVEMMLDRLDEAVLLFDHHLKLIRASRSAEQLLARRREQMAGRSLEDLFPASSAVGTLVHEAVERRKAVHDATVTLDRASAGPVRVLVNVELLEGFPEPGRFGLLLTLRDAEMRRQIRSQLDISTRLAAINRLTGGVAHEIKNPLNAMALHLEILKSKLTPYDDVQNEVEVIGGEIARLDRVVKTFLDFTRPVEIKLQDINMVELARQVAALVWPEAEQARVSIELESPQPAAMIRGDADLLKQALLNVVSNGIEAMKNSGRLRIQVKLEGEEVVVTVADEGAGIPEELRDKIFNLYFSTKKRGSGIGLAMTFRIVQLHNATIDFVSSAGEGTTFHMRYPAAEPSRRGAAIETVDSGAGVK
ncbi:MAG: PAS domain-containing protein [Acidobacteriia bacterium]|nr:PAS domain-containing protein [Terriglobia bacterium]